MSFKLVYMNEIPTLSSRLLRKLNHHHRVPQIQHDFPVEQAGAVRPFVTCWISGQVSCLKVAFFFFLVWRACKWECYERKVEQFPQTRHFFRPCTVEPVRHPCVWVSKFPWKRSTNIIRNWPMPWQLHSFPGMNSEATLKHELLSNMP